MSAQTGIEWADSTFNPWQGCTKVSPACDHCYAERQTARFKSVEWGAGKPRVRTSVANWKLPERWNREQFYQCSACGWRGLASGPKARCCQCSADGVLVPSRRRVFCASLADVFDNEVPIEWLVDLLDLIRRTPNIDWMLLTKRIGNWRWRLMSAHGHLVESVVDGELSNWVWEWLKGNPPANVWVGATFCNQDEWNRDARKLLAVPAVVHFGSFEPLLSAIHIEPDFLTRWPNRQADVSSPRKSLDWIIAGGESGPHARPMHPDWVRSLRDQCAAAGVPFLFKQWGEWAPVDPDMPSELQESEELAGKLVGGMHRIGKKAAGRQLDGRTHNGFPVVQP